MFTKYSITTLIIGLATLFAFSVQQANAQSEADLYAKAKEEGKVVWYGSASVQAGNPLAQAFEKKYPGIKVEYLRQPSGATYQRVLQEMKIGANLADVMSTTVIAQYIDLEKKGQLMKYRPPEAAHLLPVFEKMGDDYYQITFVGMNFLVYNPNVISAKDAPRSWKDLTDPKYKGKVSMANAATSGYGAVTALLMLNLYGVDYLKALAHNDVLLTRSSNDTVMLAISAERPIGVAPSQIAYRNVAKGNPVKIVFPSDGTIVHFGPTAILAKAPHPNAAKLLFNFFLSKEGNGIMAQKQYESIRADVPPPSGGKSLADITTLQATADELIHELPKVKKQFAEIFR